MVVCMARENTEGTLTQRGEGSTVHSSDANELPIGIIYSFSYKPLTGGVAEHLHLTLARLSSLYLLRGFL